MKSAARNQYRLRDAGDIGNHLAAVEGSDHGTQGDFDSHVLTFSASTIFALTVAAALGDKTAGVTKIRERVEVGAADDVDRSTVATVATIGATHRYIFFAPKTDDAVTTIAGFDKNFRLVYKFHRGIITPGQ